MSQQLSSNPEEEALRYLVRAEQLESQISALPSKAPELNGLQSELCDALGRVIVASPNVALRKDCCGRLWRQCFYKTIAVRRRLVSREKRKNGPKLAELERNLGSHLDEGLTFYCSMARKLEDMLRAQNQGQKDSHHENVVPVLYRILISLGDLYRYSSRFQDAGVIYERASILAPGRGTPYNQQAVIALDDSSSPLSADAMYFYARAVMATHEPFETSLANMARLFESNREWIKKNPQQHLQLGIPTKKASKDLKNAQKSAAVTRLLAQFVDLHFSFSKQADEAVLEKMGTFLNEFQSLIAAGGFGDKSLCRMAVVNAFSVVPEIPIAAKPEGPFSEKAENPYAHMFALRFGACLVDRMEQSARKASELYKKHGRSGPPNVKAIVPVLLIAEFAANSKSPESFDSASGDLAGLLSEVERVFWTKMAHAGNLISSITLHVDLSQVEGQLPREYKSFCGYLPYKNFIDTPGEFISPEEAMVFFENEEQTKQAKKSQDTEKAKEPSNKELLVRLGRFLHVLNGMIGKKVVKDANGQFQLCSTTPPKDTRVSKEVQDLVAYRRPDDGDGPELLVPSAFLVNNETKSPMNPKPALTGVDLSGWSVMDDGQEPVVKSPKMAVGAPPGVSLDMSQITAPEPASTPTDPVAQQFSSPELTRSAAATPATLSPPHGLQPPPGFAPATLPVGSRAPTTSAPPGFAASAASPAVLGVYRQEPVISANPFMDQPRPRENQNTQQQQQVATASFLDPVEETTLLDSSLLKSLWMDEQNKPLSKNPFLT